MSYDDDSFPDQDEAEEHGRLVTRRDGSIIAQPYVKEVRGRPGMLQNARTTTRPDGSTVYQPYVKKTRTGTWVYYPNSKGGGKWVFYPNKKSQGRTFKPYQRKKKVGGEPDVEYSQKRAGRPPAGEPELEEQVIEISPEQSQEQMPELPSQFPQPGNFGNSIFTDVLNNGRRPPAKRTGNIAQDTVDNAVTRFLGGF